MKTKITVLLLSLASASILPLQAQLGKCKGKYLGNIIAYSVPKNYTDLWNQTTSENGSKWGSCDRGNGVYNFDNSDLAYNTAKNSGGAFKFHALVWGSQAPKYLASADASTITAAIRKWYKAVEDHYKPMGGLDFIDVLNEPVNTPINKEVSNLKAALTLGYKQEAANAGDLNNPYGWAIWPFQLARKHFPNATLLINEFNIEMNWGNCRAEYIRMAKAIKAAPNLTDGSKNLIDGIGLQAHGIEDLTPANFKACIDELWNSTGLAVHITEIDIVADPNEEFQRSKFASLLPIAWEHEHVAGITLWGYIQGSTWRPGNKASGPGGTDSGIQYSNLTDRPAMTWIKQYFASQTDLACCPDPGPFANCINGIPPKVSFTLPTETEYTAPATVNFDVEATDADGTISHIDFFMNNEKDPFHEEWMAPYGFDTVGLVAGNYQVKAVAYDDAGNTGEDIITFAVQGPYNGTAHAIPGTIEFEHYDIGGNGFAYSDGADGNTGGADFRTDEDVDIEICKDDNGGYNIGYATAGEWLEYTIDVPATASYNIDLRVACKGTGRTISLSSGGKDIVPSIDIPDTGDWQAWETVTVENVELQAGVQVLRVTIGSTDYVNLNFMDFSYNSIPPTISITSPADNTTATTDDEITIAADASTAEGTITDVSFYANGKLIGTDASAPYSFSWTNTAPGDYTIKAVATNSNGISVYEEVSITITQAPIELKEGWNLVGCPIIEDTELSAALTSVWSNVVTVKNADGFYAKAQPNYLNSLDKLEIGRGYFVKVSKDCTLDWPVK